MPVNHIVNTPGVRSKPWSGNQQHPEGSTPSKYFLQETPNEPANRLTNVRDAIRLW
jgi:hypothetical protein